MSGLRIQFMTFDNNNDSSRWNLYAFKRKEILFSYFRTNQMIPIECDDDDVVKILWKQVKVFLYLQMAQIITI